MKNVLFYSVYLILCTACQNNSQNEFKVKYCNNNLDAFKIDQFPLYKSYDDYSTLFEVDFDVNISTLKGSVKEINEMHFIKKTMFDEEILSLTSEILNEYDEHNQLLVTKNKSNLNSQFYISRENKYNDDGKLLSLESFSDDYNFIYSYSYSEEGLLTSQKYKGEINPSNLNDRSMLNESWSMIINYFYDDKNQRIKEIKKSIYNQDSSVVKYKYEAALGRMPYQIIKYDKSGSRISISNLSYDNSQNKVVIRTWKTLFTSFSESGDFSNKNLDSEIVISFDDNCKIISISKVSMWIKNMKKYAKAEYNENGDIIYWSKFLYPKNSENDFDLTYLKEFDIKYKLENEGEYYDYIYDKMGNWVERQEGNQVVKRQISYR